METEAFIEVLRTEGRLFADAAAKADAEAPVPACPGWRVRDLVEHLGSVHRWARGYVTEGRQRREPLPDPPSLAAGELAEWLREGHEALVAALAAAPAGLECWSFLPAPSPLAFWARRQAHETAVHRVDAEAALGAGLSPVAPEFAADGIDELLCGFHARHRSRVRTPEPRTLRVRATDVPGAAWTLHLTPDAPPRTERGGESPADATWAGPAGEMYLTVWNRTPEPPERQTVSGDASLVRLWRESSGI
ncbi:maleylpyruvate isomerase family mycothiol-dependent enzyme [Streptomyces sp. ODS28]|uniref:maleylpyruvate isomerase family mycothiol-dependent enzyme n=1 Tax=Streptomyces sp. ODS28 TaxID=3136688 RepID=UPI0031EAC302